MWKAEKCRVVIMQALPEGPDFYSTEPIASAAIGNDYRNVPEKKGRECATKDPKEFPKDQRESSEECPPCPPHVLSLHHLRR